MIYIYTVNQQIIESNIYSLLCLLQQKSKRNNTYVFLLIHLPIDSSVATNTTAAHTVTVATATNCDLLYLYTTAIVEKLCYICIIWALISWEHNHVYVQYSV